MHATKWQAFGLSPSFDYDAPKFTYRGEMQLEPLRRFCEDYLRGALRPTVKSAEPPEQARA